jgi:hypothetical protein
LKLQNNFNRITQNKMKTKSYIYSLFIILILTSAVLSDNFVKAESRSGIEVTEVQLGENLLSRTDVYRVGAKCCDGTNSKATGRGACSHHGGVKYWKMSDGTTVSTGKCN